jgi:protein-disulfide isomerase
MAKNNSSKSPNRAPFYAVLLIIVLGGIGAILYMQKNPTRSQSSAAYEDLRTRYANAGPPQPYVIGDTNAPVVIEEFADYECPSCANYAVITEPDVRKRIVSAGLAYYKYYDFPLPGHNHSPAASLAAACADEQQKFWEMHDQLFTGQDQWGLGPTNREVVDNPKPVFKRFAQNIGLDIAQWESCYDSGKYNDRVNANAGEALRRNVESTPTFFINGKKVIGAISYDEMKRLVDEAAKAGPISAADSAMNNMIQHSQSDPHGH